MIPSRCLERQMITIFLLGVVATTSMAFDSSKLNKLTIINATGRTISYLFISPGDSEHWGPDMLGTDTLANGASVSYYMHYPRSSGAFDIMAVDGNGQRYEVRNFALRDGTEGRIRLTSAHATERKSPDVTWVKITNRSGYDINYLFFSPSDSTMYGADILGSTRTLPNGSSYEFSVLKSGGRVSYDVWAADTDDDDYKKTVTVDFSQSSQEFIITLSDLQR